MAFALRVAPSIYFLGYAGSVIVNGLKISGASGIYKAKDYKKGSQQRSTKMALAKSVTLTWKALLSRRRVL